jgi:hypothetical protein
MAVNTASDLVVGQILLLIRSLQLLIFYLYKLFLLYYIKARPTKTAKRDTRHSLLSRSLSVSHCSFIVLITHHAEPQDSVSNPVQLAAGLAT